MALGTGMSLHQAYKLDIKAQESNILAIDSAAKSIVDHYVSMAQSGEMTQQAAQKAALAAVSSLRYDNGNYVFVLNEKGVVLAEIDPANVGKNFMDFQDSKGKVFIPAMLDAAMHGQIFFQHYYFPRVAGGPAQPKISVMVAVPEWGWALGTGVYLDNLQQSVVLHTAAMLPYLLPLGLFYLLAIFASCRQVYTMLQRLSAAMRDLAAGKLDIDIPYTKRADQIGKMASTLANFRESAIEKNRLQEEAADNQRAQELARHEREVEAERHAAEQAEMVSALGAGLNRMARGDLSDSLENAFPPAYEQLRQDFNLAVAHLQEMLRTIDTSASGVRVSADEIMQAADDLSKRTEQQAAALEETTAALDNVTTTVKQTANSAGDALKVVNTTHESATHSGKIVNEAVNAMGEIEDSSRQIGNIIGIIDDIAFQTNLLALNAGVEAARAGDAGRGFAVVATEVRALAQRSAEAAKEIKALISKSGTQVTIGVRLVAETGNSLTKIADYIEQLNRMMQDIAQSANVQAAGLSEVNTAMNQMDQMTQQNAAMVEETTAASHALSSESKGLKDLISAFSFGASAGPVAARKTVEQPRAFGVTKMPAPTKRSDVVADLAHRIEKLKKASNDESWDEF